MQAIHSLGGNRSAIYLTTRETVSRLSHVAFPTLTSLYFFEVVDSSQHAANVRRSENGRHFHARVSESHFSYQTRSIANR
jgi:hypothetical protein